MTLNPLIIASELRRKAFIAALSDFGMEPRRDWIIPGIVGPIGEETATAYVEATRLLKAAAHERPDAIVCGKDSIALQVYMAALRLGLRIPEDVAVIGFDDFILISETVEPPLTTVALPYYEIGRRVAHDLIALMSGEPPEIKVERIACPLIRRASA
ncbi:MAG: hypothetical protein D6782_09050 [Alphaproteobacteria bacterium]|nr:MAG: hypothetical protein D6782_09050 [Alphaproteobacteria bacterium]